MSESGNEFYSIHFKLIENKFHCLRSGYSYRIIPHSQIQRLMIVTGIRTKHPIRLFIFGCLILIVPLALFLYSTGFIEGILNGNGLEFENVFQGAKAFAAHITMILFLSFMGLLSIYQSLVPTLILELKLFDGTKEIYSLSKLRKNDRLTDLIEFLTTKFPREKLIIDKTLFV